MSRRWLWLVPFVALFAFGLILLHETRESSGAPAPKTTSTEVDAKTRIAPLAAPSKPQANRAPDAAEPAIDDDELFRLEGQVVDEDQRPLRGVKVTVMTGSKPTAFSEADGSFALDNILGGITTVIAERGELYAEAQTHWVGADSDPVMLTLERGAPLTVRVLETGTNKPIPDATVGVGNREGTTGTNGVIKFKSIDVDYERIRISATGFGSYKSRITIDAEHPFVAQSITVHLGRAALVSGIVVDEAGTPVPDARVWIESASGTWDDVVTADATGAWSIDTLGPGRHAARASSDKHVEKPAIIFESDGKHPKTGIVLRVTLGSEVAGLVVDATGKPVAGASIRGISAPDTGPDGRFLAQGLDTGERDISAYLGSRGSPEQTVQIPATGRIEIKIVIAESSIAGTIVDTDGNPIPEASVWARSTGTNFTHMFDDADEFGAFDFGGMPPGEYELVAQRPEEARRPLPDKGSGLVVRTGARNVKVIAPSVSTVAGRVVLGGTPVAFYGVVITKDATSITYETPLVVHDPKGEFAQKDIAPGTWSVVIVGPGFLTKVIDNVTVVDGTPTKLGDIVVNVGRTIRGRVTDERGTGLGNSRVAIDARSFYPDSDRLGERLRGNASARTDASGRYEISGLDPSVADLTIAATHDRGASAKHEIAANESTIDLVIAPTGEILGTIANMLPAQHGVVAHASNDMFRRYTGDVDVGGGFRITGVPPGEYKVSVIGRNSLPTLTVVVTANQPTTASFTMPATPITLEVTANGCKLVALEVADGSQSESLVMSSCDDHGVSTLEQLSPGSYKVCIDLDRCAPITIAPGRARQRFTMPAAKP